LRQLLPMLGVALITAFAWERLFAISRRRAPDAGWLMAAWLFVLLLPPVTPLWLVALGMSFGALFGAHVFGGTGCYVASPAVVGAIFLHFSYPSILADSPPWISIAESVASNAPGVLAYVFFLTCAAGAFTLVASGAASARTLLGALFVLLPAVFFSEMLIAAEHVAAGSFAFCWAFLLTDPTTQALTRAARWLHGVVFTLLVVLIRTADPAGPDGVLFAVLLAGLLVPLLDYVVLSIQRSRRGTTLELRR
ncbi:MAG: RnfABCDGE type electron transport complex subunit D, partial [Woeseia sp.]|nr:RnfABCDGE type electron transport complex subunit D [Woeseia sp.]